MNAKKGFGKFVKKRELKVGGGMILKCFINTGMVS